MSLYSYDPTRTFTYSGSGLDGYNYFERTAYRDRFAGNLMGYEGMKWIGKQSQLANIYNSQYGTGTGFTDDWQAGQREKMAMWAATNMQVDRKKQFFSTLSDFQENTNEFMRRHADMQIAQDSMEADFARQDLAIQDVLTNLDKGGSRATSRKQYMQLAQDAMRETQAALNKVSNFKMPELRDLPTEFIDPFSGRQLDMSKTFDDVYTSEVSSDIARQAVMGRFHDTRRAVLDDIYGGISAQYGDIDVIGRSYENNLAGLMGQYNAANQIEHGLYGSAMWNSRQAERDQLRAKIKDITGYDVTRTADKTALEALQAGVSEYANAHPYASAAALADLADNTSWMWYETTTKKGKGQINPLEFYLSRGVNTQAELDKIIDYTTSKFDVDFRTEEMSYRNEFEARRQRAIEEVNSAKRNQELNDLRAGQMEQQKRSLQQRLERQQQEYQQTLAGMGMSMSDDEGVTFSDSRPS